MSLNRLFSGLTPAGHQQHLRNLDYVCQIGLAKLMPGIKPKRLGKGSFCCVYEGPTPDSVIRFNTCAGADGDFLRDCAEMYFTEESMLYRPKVFDTCEEANDMVFELTEARQMPQVAFVVIERLVPLKNRSLAYHLNKLLHMLASNGNFPRVAPCKVPLDEAYIEKWASHPRLAGIKDYAANLSSFCADYELRIDKVSHDLMMREDGHIVITDPVLKGL